MFVDYSDCHKLILEDEDSLQIACVKYLKQTGLLFTSEVSLFPVVFHHS